MKRLSLTLSRKSLLTIYKFFVRPILDYADYDLSKEKLISKMVQYRAALVITVAIKETSRHFTKSLA